MDIYNNQDFIPQLSIDCVIFGYRERELRVLIPKLLVKGDFWGLPSGFIRQNESIDNAAQRILEERTTIRGIYLEQFRVFGQENRTNKALYDKLFELNQAELDKEGILYSSLDWMKQRFVSIGYYALVDINKVNPQKTPMDESIDWYSVKNLPNLIIDQTEIVEYALKSLQRDLDAKLLGFNLLPETFTMRELQELYEAVYDKHFPMNNFQKKILELNVLERLEKKFTGAANKAPYLYRFRK